MIQKYINTQNTIENYSVFCNNWSKLIANNPQISLYTKMDQISYSAMIDQIQAPECIFRFTVYMLRITFSETIG